MLDAFPDKFMQLKRDDFSPLPDDEYEGMFIPKGSMVFLGIWAMHHDDKIYPHHDEFNPDRYLNHPKLAPDYAVGADYKNRDKYFLSHGG